VISVTVIGAMICFGALPWVERVYLNHAREVGLKRIREVAQRQAGEAVQAFVTANPEHAVFKQLGTLRKLSPITEEDQDPAAMGFQYNGDFATGPVLVIVGVSYSFTLGLDGRNPPPQHVVVDEVAFDKANRKLVFRVTDHR
jgi:hypothetical protein